MRVKIVMLLACVLLGLALAGAPPAAASDRRAEFLGVSCVSSTFCVAVGRDFTSEYEGSLLIERWNGSGWKIWVRHERSALLGVSCVSATFCVAVGYRAPIGGPLQPIAEMWDGTDWTFSILPNDGQNDDLAAVSCPSTTSCLAVGSKSPYSAGGFAPLDETWSNGRWSLDLRPGDGNYTGVDCPATGHCVASGLSSAGTFVDRFAAPFVTRQTLAGNNIADSVSCAPTVSSCFVVGTVPLSPLALRLSGTSAAKTRVPIPSGVSVNQELEDVDCVTASWCMTVASSTARSNTAPATWVWDGSAWMYRAGKPVAGNSPVQLQGVSCVSATFCMMAGYEVLGQDSLMNDITRTVAQMWNGTSWRALQPS